MPGFVDCHTHLVFPPSGGSDADEQSAARWFVPALAEVGGARTLSCGSHGAATAPPPWKPRRLRADESAEIKILRALSALKRDPLDVVTTFLLRLPSGGRGEEAAERRWNRLHGVAPQNPPARLARFADLVWDSDDDSAECFARYLRLARSLGFACKIHADERSPAAAIAAAIEQLVVSIDHLEHATAAEAALLGGSSTLVTLLASRWVGQRRPLRACTRADRLRRAVALAPT